MSQPQILIEPDEELHIVCRLLYYNIPGFYPNAKKLYNVCQKEGYSFRLRDIAKWLVYQYIHQIYRQPLPCKAEASFSKIKLIDTQNYKWIHLTISADKLYGIISTKKKIDKMLLNIIMLIVKFS